LVEAIKAMCGEDKECAKVMADGIANGAVDLDGP